MTLAFSTLDPAIMTPELRGVQCIALKCEVLFESWSSGSREILSWLAAWMKLYASSSCTMVMHRVTIVEKARAQQTECMSVKDELTQKKLYRGNITVAMRCCCKACFSSCAALSTKWLEPR